VPDEVEMEVEGCREVKRKLIEDIKVEKESDEAEMILKYFEEMCGKVLDFTDLGAQESYKMEWNDVMETDEVQVAQIYCEEVSDEMEWSSVVMETDEVQVARIYSEELSNEREWSSVIMETDEVQVAQIYSEELSNVMEWSSVVMETDEVHIGQIYCEEVKGKVIEDIKVEKENDELEVGQHYCGEESGEVIDARNMNGVKRKRKTMNRKRDKSSVDALKAK
jgi:hypothetical protein